MAILSTKWSFERSLLFFLLFFPLHGEEFPVLYKGRYRPAEAYARLWLYERYHAPTLKKENLNSFHTDSSSPLALLWSLEVLGSSSYRDAPLFWIQSAELKKWMGLSQIQNRFSYQELKKVVTQNSGISLQNKQMSQEWGTLLSFLKEFEQLQGTTSPLEEAFENRWKELSEKRVSPKEIGRLLEKEYPLIQRLQLAGILFKTLPSRYKDGEWLPLKALKVKTYDTSSQELKLVKNFTQFSDEQFEKIRKAYLQLTIAQSSQEMINIAEKSLSQSLLNAYAPLAGTIIQQAHGKQLTSPSILQLNMELFTLRHPWIFLLIILYGVGCCFLLISYRNRWVRGHQIALGVIALAITCHTALLLMRSYILERPPVSNMFETVIYVPWIAACATLFIPAFRKNTLAILAACFTSIALLVILEVTDLNQNLDQVQAVLDSQFWLFVHVLLVVGSYGIFILGAMMGHFYLGLSMFHQQFPLTTRSTVALQRANPLDRDESIALAMNEERYKGDTSVMQPESGRQRELLMFHREETSSMKQLSWMILQTMYAGTVMLVTGTVLGGIWAAESWGRFWDWDPKESWAFISSCFYLIWIHAYRFHRIGSFGLAVGSVGGLLAISFTWYGVNYILGTGLHSYGFGSGGEIYYYAFVIAECLFLTAALCRKNLYPNS